MNAAEQRHERLRVLFLKAAAVPAHEREACVREGAGEDDSLAAEVLGLLSHDSTTPGAELLHAPLIAPEVLPRNIMCEPQADLQPGSRMGHYTIESLIGMGGMGAVYRARQDKPDRIVALKVIQPALATPAMLRRIELEAELLGRLHHPGIAQIHEGGTFEITGGAGRRMRPFFAMEFVDGPNLGAYAAAHALDARARIALICRVCEAVQHAHQKGVIHRDLKPGNILVDSSGQPKVVDFGVAMATDPELRLTTIVAGESKLIGTIQYMSPEQICGDVTQVDTRSDVYALGVVLFELLAGRLPHELESKAVPEMARVIREEPHRTLGSVVRELRGELDTVIARALAKDPARRYQSAGALADDLKRFLDGQPIQARADSVLYVLRKRINRYRGIVAAACVAAIGLSISAVVAIREARKAVDAKEVADDMRGIAELETKRAKDETEKQRRQAYFANIGFASAALQSGEIARVRRSLAECPEDLRGWEWRYLIGQSDTSIARIQVIEDEMNIASVSFGSIMCLHYTRGIVMIDEATQQARARITLPASSFSSAALSGGRLCCLVEGKLRVLTSDGSVERELETHADAAIRAVTPDSRCVFVSHSSRKLELVPLDGSRGWSTELPTTIQVVNVSPDGRIYAGTSLGDGLVAAVNAADGRILQTVKTGNGGVRALAASPDGKAIAVGGVDGTVSIWGIGTGLEQLVKSHVHSNKVTALAWSADSRHIATGSSDHLVHVLEAETLSVVKTMIGHERTVVALGFEPQDRLVSASLDGTVRWWKTGSTNGEVVAKLPASMHACVTTANGKVVCSGTGRRVYVLEGTTLKTVSGIVTDHGMASDLASLGDERVAACFSDGAIDIFSLGATKEPARRLWTNAGGIADIEGNAARGWVLTAGMNGTATAIDVLTGDEVSRWTWGAPIFSIAMDRGGKHIAIGEANGSIHIIDAQSRQETHVLRGLDSVPWRIVFSNDGETVFAAGGDWRIRKWPTAGGAATVFAGHTGAVHSLALSPDGSRLASGGHDNSVRLWDAASGTELLLLSGHTGAVHGLSFSPDGRALYSSSDTGEVRMWSVREQGGERD